MLGRIVFNGMFGTMQHMEKCHVVVLHCAVHASGISNILKMMVEGKIKLINIQVYIIPSCETIISLLLTFVSVRTKDTHQGRLINAG